MLSAVNQDLSLKFSPDYWPSSSTVQASRPRALFLRQRAVLIQGCRTKRELERIKRGLAIKQTEILPLTPSISQRAMQLIDAHTLSDGLQAGDALIAAGAIEHDLILLTGNTKHFVAIAELKIERFEP